jgi:hypothetical protein
MRAQYTGPASGWPVPQEPGHPPRRQVASRAFRSSDRCSQCSNSALFMPRCIEGTVDALSQSISGYHGSGSQRDRLAGGDASSGRNSAEFMGELAARRYLKVSELRWSAFCKPTSLLA